MIQHSNADWDEYYGMSEEELDWHTSEHTDDEWKALYKVNTDKDRASIFQMLLLDILKEKRYHISQLEKESEFFKNRAYVTNRNKFVHPDDNMNAEKLREELEKIKKETRERLTWLIKATDVKK